MKAKEMNIQYDGNILLYLGLPPVEGATDLSAVSRASIQSLKDGPVHLEKEVINQYNFHIHTVLTVEQCED